jgi:hypothetical protein
MGYYCPLLSLLSCKYTYVRTSTVERLVRRIFITWQTLATHSITDSIKDTGEVGGIQLPTIWTLTVIERSVINAGMTAIAIVQCTLINIWKTFKGYLSSKVTSVQRLPQFKV